MRTWLPAEPPVDISREQAASEAAEELSKAQYREGGDSLVNRGVQQVVDWIAALLDDVAGTSPSGRAGLLLLLGLIALVVVVVLWRAGALRTTRTTTRAVFDAPTRRRAAHYRAEAEAAAAAGDFATAVRSRFRACIAELTERTVLDDRAGRTAYEAVADAGRAVPALLAPLRPAALEFTEVVYGNRPGTPERYAVVVAADEAARTISTRSLVRSVAG